MIDYIQGKMISSKLAKVLNRKHIEEEVGEERAALVLASHWVPILDSLSLIQLPVHVLG